MGKVEFDGVQVEMAMAGNKRFSGRRPQVKQRSFFPETWLFDLKTIREDGIANIKEPVPDTITEWIGKALCTSTEAGIGLSPPASVVTFQPFFVSFNLPYSIIRGEVAPLVLSVFNYMKSCISVQLTLKESADFSIVGDSSVELCICSNEQKGHTYKIKPNRIGYIDLEVTAMPNTPEKAMCGNEIIVPEDSPADAVKRRLLVEPEGVEQEYTYSDLVCLSANSSFFTKTVGLELPSNYVADSARGYVSLIGDIMGPSLNGLDGLVRMPMGCGEQNMILFAPTIFVMQYLTNTRQLTDAIKTKSLGFMKVGYQRELNYRHNDGSFSAFGNSDGSGSMWLTAFVVKAFHQAKPFIFIDQADIDKTIKWITKNQDEEGCFPSIGRVIHKDMRGGLDRPNAKVGLTAFVLISLLEAGVPVDDASVQKALRCIDVSEVPESDVYTTILIAYVHTLVNPTSESTEALMEKLVTMAKTDGETTHWEKVKVEPTAAPEKRKIVGDIIIDGDHHGGLGMTSPVDSKPLDVEMTAYALMALLNYKKTDSVPIALPIIRWLTTQRNAEGGFKSTQDTVVALQALAKYASFFSTSGTGSYVNVKTDKKENTFHVNADNKLILQKVEVNLPAQVAISANGTGCVLVQSNAKYNVPKDTLTVPAFVVTPSVAAVEHSPCEQQRMKICAKFEGSEPSSMAIVEVKMVSGWIPDKISVIEARKRNHLLKRVETKMNLVNFYFDEIPNEETCFSFTMEQLMKVDETKPGYVKVYDYYEPNLATTQPYSIQLGDKC